MREPIVQVGAGRGSGHSPARQGKAGSVSVESVNPPL
jgi:hypothetical protein